MTMSTIDHARLRALAEAATPGPWEAETWTHQFDDEITFGYVEANECSIWDHSGGNTVANAADADYIAAIDPPTLIALLDRLDAAREYIDNPGNWSALDGRRRLLLAILDGKDPR